MADYDEFSPYPKPMLTDARPRPEIPAFADDPRPADVLAGVIGIQRRKSSWRRHVVDPVADFIDQLLFAARSIS